MSDAAGLSPGRTLWDALGDIPDRRGAKGRRYPLRSVLTLSLAACWPAATTCARSSAGDAGCRPRRCTCSASSGRPATPCTTTSTRPLLLQGPRRGRDRTGVGRLGARVLLGAWAQGSSPLGPVAIDGKRLRGVPRPGTTAARVG